MKNDDDDDDDNKSEMAALYVLVGFLATVCVGIAFLCWFLKT